MMTALKCPTDEQLHQLALGRLAADESDQFFEHIEECPDCRDRLESAGDVEDSLLAVLRDSDDSPRFESEPDCRLAVEKAIDAQALIDTALGSDEVNLPRFIGEYEIVRPLGRGGMGSVYLARHNKLGREAALKVLAHHRLADPRMRKRFEAEMRAVGRLNHPNVVTAHDARDVEGTAVLVTEFIDGLNAEEIVNRIGPLPLAEACEIARKVAEALAYIDAHGFVHRDVKPSNIMLSKTGEVKLLDLGLARLQFDDSEHSQITGPGQVMGTADYVAPEQVSDPRQVDIRADLYSLGCTLFKLLTGQTLFSGPDYATAFSKLTAHVSVEPPSLADHLSNAPAELVKLHEALLDKKVERRPQTPKQVAELLEQFAAGSDLTALIERAETLSPRPMRTSQSTPSRSNPIAKPFRKRQVPIGVAIASGLVGMVIGLLLGIIITITNPDGSKTKMELADGSRVEIASSPEKATQNTPTKAADSLEKQLQGIWQAVSGERGDASFLTAETVHLMAFSDDEFYMVDDGKVDEAGIYSVESASSGDPHSIDLKDQFGQKGTLLGIARFLENGNLQLCFPVSPKSKRPSSFAGVENGERRVLMTYERLTNNVRQNPLSMRDLHDPDKRPLWKAMSDIMMAHQMGPENLKKVVEDHRQTTGAAKTRNNLKQIAIAFHNFHDTYRKLPGTANIHSSDKDKKFPYSWRVAILPFINESKLYEQYRFDEPWDSEANLKLLEKMPEVYKSPFAEKNAKPGYTIYQGFAGEQTALGTGSGLAFKDFTDGTSNTLLVMEAGESVPWTKPEDMPFPTPPGGKMVFPNREAIHYLTADGAVHSLTRNDIPKLTPLITRNARDVVDQPRRR